MPYELQLAHKRRTVALAYTRFSGLTQELVPEVRETVGSPKQWGYRTKITPHFDAPPNWARKAELNAKPKPELVREEETVNGLDMGVQEEAQPTRKWECRIGFERKGRPGVLDIEVSTTVVVLVNANQCAFMQECPIATSVINLKLAEERARVQA